MEGLRRARGSIAAGRFQFLGETSLPLGRRHRWRWAGATALTALLLAAPALAASDHALGDGSGVDNERLLPDVYPIDPVLTDGRGLAEPYDPFFDVDWSVALRGSYTKATGGERFDVRLVPSVGFEHIGTRSAINLDASAELTRPSEGGNITLGALRLGLQGGYALDSVTRVTASGNLGLTQPSPGTLGLASTIANPAQTTNGAAELGITRQFGKFNVGLSGGAERNVYGATTLTNGSITNNSEQNFWSLDSALRVGFQATPIFEVFGVAGLGRDVFDLPSSVLLVRPDATDTTLKGGVTGRWNGILEATGSVGVGLRRFDETSLGEVVTQLYDAQVSFRPDPTWRLSAGFATQVAPPGPNAGGTARVNYTANAEIGYTVNSWLALRALANWNAAQFTASPDTETGYGFGAGADYMVNAHTAVTADYGFERADSSANGEQQAHRVTLGITLSR